MHATCPKNPKHGKFVTVAHVSEDWIVDPNGNFLELPENPERQTVHGPTIGNTWSCAICGAEAIVKPS
jgi:hypothetical protein